MAGEINGTAFTSIAKITDAIFQNGIQVNGLTITLSTGGIKEVMLYGSEGGNGGFPDSNSACATNKFGVIVNPTTLYINEALDGIFLDQDLNMPFQALQIGRFYWIGGANAGEVYGKYLRFEGGGRISIGDC